MKDLKLSLIVQALDRASEPLKRVSESLTKVSERAEHLHHALHKLGLAEFIGGAFLTGAALEAGRGIFELTEKVAEMGETALKNHEKTGASVEGMQRWTWAAKQMGVEADSVVRSFGMMQVHLSEALSGNKQRIADLKLLGVSLKEVRQLSTDPSALFDRVMMGFSNIKNPLAQARVGRDMFSRGWMEMAPLLKAPREEVERLMDQLRKAHVVMTKEQAEAGHEFGVAQGNMGLAVAGLGVRIGKELVPRLTEAMNKIANWIEGLSDDAVNKFADAVGKLADDFVKLLPTIQKVVEKGVDLADKLLKLADNTSLVKGVFVALAGVLTAQVIVSVVSTAASITSVGVAAVRAAGLIWSLIPAVGGLTDAMVLFDLALDANPIGVIALAIGALIAALALLGLGIVAVHDHWDDIVTFMEDGCLKIEKAFTKLESVLPKWLRDGLNGAISLQFPGLAALGQAFDSVAHATRPSSLGANPGAAATGAFGDNFQGSPFVKAPAGSRAHGHHHNHHHMGTITVEAAPGTRIKKLTSNSSVDFTAIHRGQLFA